MSPRLLVLFYRRLCCSLLLVLLLSDSHQWCCFCWADEYEGNNSAATAFPVQMDSETVVLLHTEVAAGDDDWFLLTACARCSIQLSITFDQTQADLDAFLFLVPELGSDSTAPTHPPLAQSTSPSGEERLFFFNSNAEQSVDVLLQLTVFLAGQTLCEVRIETTTPEEGSEEQRCEPDSFEPNDTPELSAVLSQTQLPLTATLCNSDIDWYQLSLCPGCSAALKVNNVNPTSTRDLDLFLYGPDYALASFSTSLTARECVTFNSTVDQAQLIWIQVVDATFPEDQTADEATYTLTIDIAASSSASAPTTAVHLTTEDDSSITSTTTTTTTTTIETATTTATTTTTTTTTITAATDTTTTTIETATTTTTTTTTDTTTSTTTTMTATASTAVNGDAWLQLEDREFLVVDDAKLPFDAAQSACAAVGASLASVLSAVESDWLHGVALTRTENNEVWLGGVFETPGELSWIDGSSVASFVLPWKSGEPNTHPRAQCLLFNLRDGSGSATGLWEATRCSRSRSFICSRPTA